MLTVTKDVVPLANYYNECDPFAAAWLRNLIDGGHIAPGDVDTRSIVDVRPSDLHGYIQCHFFAGIGGWSLAARFAGVGDDVPIWTGSCPCQPFSAAGKSAGFDDERHLWPHFHWLIEQCGPATIFGEQVASKDGLEWLDLVQSDLEGSGYAFAAADLCAASVGAPHIRQRLWWYGRRYGVANTDGNGCARSRRSGITQGWKTNDASPRSEVGNMADTDDSRLERWIGMPECSNQWVVGTCDLVGELGNAASHGERQSRITEAGERCEGAAGRSGAWDDCDWLPCTDGKSRPVEPGTFPLVDGLSFKLGSSQPFEGKSRVGMLKGYGNAIVPQLAAEFIRAALC